MTRSRVALGLLMAGPLVFACFAPAGDAEKGGGRGAASLRAKVAKEPAYQSKEPGYCLLTLGGEGKRRVWLVFDSVPNPLAPGKDRDYLYVDRKGNCDLTEAGAKVEAIVHERDEFSRLGGVGPSKVRDLEFVVGELKDEAGRTYKDVRVFLNWFQAGKRPCSIRMVSPGIGAQLTEIGLVFAARPEEAPVVHFGGPLTMRFALGVVHGLSLTEEFLLQGEIGTAGSGEKAFVSLENLSFPKELHPTAEIAFPNRKGGAPVLMKIELKRRC